MPVAVYFWLAAIVLFLILEAATVSLVSLWFAGGALAALIASALGATTAVQWIVFALVSGLLLALLWPLARKRLNRRHERTNADRLIGRAVLVTEQIDNLRETGEIRVNGVLWTAVSADGTVLPVGARVTIERIEGAKVYVRAAEAPERDETAVSG